MADEKVNLEEIFTPGFWNMKRRAWLYGIVVAAVPLLVAIGTLTTDIAQLVLNVTAAILAVGGGSMAMANLTPDSVFKVGIEPRATVRRAAARKPAAKPVAKKAPTSKK
jgi:hypothetical protein